MKPITAQTISLIGFAASQWASAQINGSRHRRRYRELIAAGLHLHDNENTTTTMPQNRWRYFWMPRNERHSNYQKSKR